MRRPDRPSWELHLPRYAQRTAVSAQRSRLELERVLARHGASHVVSFEDRLRAAESEGRDIASLEPQVERDRSGPPGINNVVLMDELAILGKTALLHDLLTRRAGSYFRTLDKAIFGR